MWPEYRKQGREGVAQKQIRGIQDILTWTFGPQDVLNANILNQNIPTLDTLLERVFQFEHYSSNLIP